jgi:HD-like signal output (HDOD) protein
MAAAVESSATTQDLDAIVEALRWFEPFKRLDHADLLVLATKSNIENIPVRQSLFKIGGNDPWMFCLLEGTVELKAADGRTQSIVAGTPPSRNLLSPLKPRQQTGTAGTPITCIRIDTSELADLNDAIKFGEISVHEYSETAPVSEQVQLHEITMLSEGFDLPSLPEVARRVRQLIDEEDANLEAVAGVVTKDPALAAKLLKAANSALFRHHAPAQTCSQAIARLGTRTTRQLVLAFSIRNLFATDSPVLKQRMRAVWEHSNEVAAISTVLARQLSHFDPEEAMLAGLLHDIGMLPILSYAARHMALPQEPVVFEQFINAMRVRAGVTVLQEWRFTEDLINVVREAENWWRDPSPMPDLADVVVVAQIHSYLGKPERPNVPSIVNLPAFKKLIGSDGGPKMSQQILDDAQPQIAEARRLLAD